jgi:acetyl esterase/lipase
MRHIPPILRFLTLLFPLLHPAAYAMTEAKDLVSVSSSTNRIVMDLSGKKLPESPNPIVPRWGMMPGIIRVDHPVLLLRKAATPRPKGTILVLPGGGYSALAVRHEGELVADFLNRQGFDAAILEYSIGHSPKIRMQALGDARKAWKLLGGTPVRAGLSAPPVGVMGFSAGGHLATRLVHSLGKNRSPQMLILIYPAYLEEHAGSRGLDPSVIPPNNTKSRLFVLIGEKDKPNWIRGASAYAEAWRHQGLAVDFHLLPGAGHGFGMKPERTGSASRWERLLSKFLSTADTIP